jgi:hypothetical protein
VSQNTWILKPIRNNPWKTSPVILDKPLLKEMKNRSPWICAWKRKMCRFTRGLSPKLWNLAKQHCENPQVTGINQSLKVPLMPGGLPLPSHFTKSSFGWWMMRQQSDHTQPWVLLKSSDVIQRVTEMEEMVRGAAEGMAKEADQGN